MLTTEFISELQLQGFSKEEIDRAVYCFDIVLQNYSVTRKEADIVLYDGNNVNQYYYDMYLGSREFQGYAKGTLNNIKIWLGKYIGELNCSVLEAQPMHVRLFLAKHRIKRNGEQMSNSSLEKIKQAISSFYGWLVQERQMTYNPAANIQGMKTPFKYQGALNSEEIAELKYACNDTREKMILEFLCSTGCRIAEFVNIKVADIDMRQKSIKVIGKGNKERIVYFSAEAKLLIENYLAEREGNGEYLLCSDDCNLHQLTTSGAREIVKHIYNRVAEHIHLEKLTPHTFRRTFAMMALRRGMTLEQVSKLLGHASLQTTMRYLEIDDNTLQAQHIKLVA